MAIEVEAKLRAAGPAALARLAAVDRIGAARLGPPRGVDEVDRYLDTAGGALAANLWACRLRRRGERLTVSLKGPAETAPSDDGLHRRPEVEGPAGATDDPAAWPASPARELLDRMRDGAPLEERLTLRQQRTEREVRIRDASIGILSLDTVEVVRDGRSAGEFHAVELELVPGDDAPVTELAVLAEELARDPDLEPDPMTKLEHALHLLGER